MRLSIDKFASAATNAALDALYVTDLKGNIQYWSESSERVFGFDADEVIDRSVEDLILVPDPADRDISVLAEVAETGDCFRDCVRRTKSGRLIHTSLSGTLIEIEKETFLAFAEQDVSNLKRSEAIALEELRGAKEQELLLESVFNGLEDSAVVATNLDGRIVLWSKGASTLFGYTEVEVLGNNWSSTMQAAAGTQSNGLADAFTTVLENERYAGDFDAVSQNGRQFPASVVALPRRNHFGDVNGLVAIIRDESDRMAVLEARAERDVAVELAKTRAEFLANMSHELRTPLHSVISLTDLVAQTPLSDDQEDMIRTIGTSAKQLLHIINDILDISRIRAGEVALQSASFSLRTVVEEALDIIAPMASVNDLGLGYEFDVGVPEFIVGDADRIRQILLNLLSNAVRFTPTGDVRVRLAIPDSKSPSPVLRCCVSDTGIGIPNNRIGLLFQDFQQLDSSITREYGGTGLGLSICRQLLELMDGKIWAESQEGKGSDFIFEFPLAIGQSEKNGIDEPAYPLNGIKLLLVDDNPADLKIIETYASRWGMEVYAEVDGRDAVNIVKQGTQFDMAIIDYRMPNMDGVAVAEAICRYSEKPFPILLISAFATDTPTIEARSDIFTAILRKPIKQSKLYDLVSGAFNERILGHIRHKPISGAADNRYSSLRILVADDNPTNRKVIDMVLGSLGYRPDLVNNGAEAVKACTQSPYDLVLMDVHMPDTDGYEATRQIRANSTTAQPRIVALTAHAMAGDREACLAAGMDAYLAKPLDLNLLRAELEATHRVSELQSETTGIAPSEANWSSAIEVISGEDLRNEMLELFRKHAPHQWATLLQAWKESDFEGMRLAAHTFKSSLHHIEELELANIVQDIELQAPDGDMEACSRLIHSCQKQIEALF